MSAFLVPCLLVVECRTRELQLRMILTDMVDSILETEACIFYYLLASFGLIEGFAVKVGLSFECWWSLASRELKLLKVVFSEALRVFNLVSAWPGILRIRYIAFSRQE